MQGWECFEGDVVEAVLAEEGLEVAHPAENQLFIVRDQERSRGWLAICVYFIEVGRDEKCSETKRWEDQTYSNRIPIFANLDLHLCMSSSAATFEAQAMRTRGRKVAKSISSHWRWPPGSIVVTTLDTMQLRFRSRYQSTRGRYKANHMSIKTKFLTQHLHQVPQ